MKKLFATAFSALLMLSVLQAQETIMLDPSFNTAGTFFYDFGFQDNLTDVKAQSDEKIVTVGTALSPAFAGQLLAVRLLQNGALDPDFNGMGYNIFTDFTESYANECVIKDDGTILIAGSRADSVYQFGTLAMRLKQDGTLDSTFGTNGFAIHEISTGDDFAYAMLELADHKILLAGTALDTAFRNAPYVARLLENGAIDSSFGVNGVSFLPIIDADNRLNRILLQTDGKIVVCGHYGFPITPDGQFNFDVLVARLNTDGSLDSTFGNTGLVITPVFTDSLNYVEKAQGMGLTADGSIVIAGYTTLPDFSFDVILMKYDSTGTLDSGFGTNGIVLFDHAIQDVAYDMEMQDDKILVAGTSGGFFFDDRDFLLARFLSDGNLDTSFAPEGYVLTTILEYFDEANAMALLPDSTIVLAGKTNNGSNNDIAVARYHYDEGTFLTTPRTSGKVSVFPNPVASSRLLSIAFEKNAGQVTARLYNIIGELMAENVLEISGNKAMLQLPARLTPGIYALNVEGSSFKIVVE